MLSAVTKDELDIVHDDTDITHDKNLLDNHQFYPIESILS